jgi:predicted nicotinamide N-methyase
VEELNTLLTNVNQRYHTYFEPIKIAGKELKFLQIANMTEYIEKLADTPHDIELPYWAKIWEGSIILAYLVSKRPADKSKECLEIGAGVGVAGMFAAAFGYQVTLTDIDEEALLFAKVSAMKNGLDIKVKKVDFTLDDLDHKYDLILASEVLYKKGTDLPLIDFFKKHLKEDGLIYLAKNRQIKAEEFLEVLEEHFVVSKKEISLRTSDEQHLIPVYTIRQKKGV